ncbi:glycoside hydrolase family 13 protein [Nocardioides okcheonensis]|uniref:glycoside hydrolase family 13 protein n=1 Tax=Nocardioides okcheonensis TaxID=2894081 RepID=UPI001E3E35C3|nr:glycoside hydrolase family 13 protein [Nocardioides okcheonensis]UFN46498.1 glycoside hydrolase family 13 protein [Nocardioides okcheonensis]
MSTSTRHDDAWWRTAVIYEIYPRSFTDANGDGHGDLPGITSRLPYLRDLGVDAIWIAPWYPSPMADGGYDVSDYTGIHPLYGTLDDARQLLEEAHRHGLRVLIDLVANHTSNQHPWFRAALASAPGSRERDRYIFRPGKGEGGHEPPNNWISAFRGSAWTRVPGSSDDSGEYYMHTFAPEQPDLNWESEDVRLAFDDILRFWLDLGVDGFRVDAAPAMGKKAGLPDAVYSRDLQFQSSEWVDNPHWDVDTLHEVMRRWRALIDTYGPDKVFVAEAVVSGPERLAAYLRPDELHTAFNFPYVHASWDPAELRTVIDDALDALDLVGAPATWAMSSHDEIRHLTRFGRDVGGAPLELEDRAISDVALGRRRARAAIFLTLALPGGAYLYQGEELGLPEVEDLPAEVLQDPVFHRSGGRIRGRDGCRVPLPWSGRTQPFGFSPPDVTPWLPQPAAWAELSVDAQDGEPGSMLTLYRRLLALRRGISDLRDPGLTWIDSPESVLHFRRGASFECVVNLGSAPIKLIDVPVLISTRGESERELPADAAAWLMAD